MKWLDGEERKSLCDYCDKPEHPDDRIVMVVRKDGQVYAAFHESCLVEMAHLCKEN